jgi:pSer/pThr/pTyr-binding forkhead associated (FHA) protein
VLLSKPEITFQTDEDLEVGLFGIANRMIQREAAEREAEAEPGATRIYRAAPAETEAASAEELGLEEPEPEPAATVTVNGKAHELQKASVVIGRSKDCDIRISDPNVSRRHAEIRQEGATYWVVDLGSTNGIAVNGHALKRAKLDDDDRITLGSTEIVFHRP